MNITIREATAEDAAALAEMRRALWPFTSAEENRKDVANILTASDMWAILAVDETGAPAGFAEVSLRQYASGCEESPVPFLEAIWTAPSFRRRGVGERLIAHIAARMREKGFREICSDALLDDNISHDAHRSWGFTETERVVYFRKPLA